MRIDGKRMLLVALSGAAVVAALDTAGWLAWQRAMAPLPAQPEVTAARLEGPLAALPAVVERSRHLPAAMFAPLTRGQAAAVLAAVGRRQRLWFPADGVGWLNLGRAAVLEGRLQGGLEDFRRGMEVDPTMAILHRLAAVVLYALGQADEALGELEEAVAIAPALQDPALEVDHADAAEVRVRAAMRRLELYPGRRSAGLADLVEGLRAAGREEDAVALLKAEAPTPSVTLLLAQVELRRGEVADALRRLAPIAGNRALPRQERAEALSLMARCHERTGDSAQALAAAERALELGSDLPSPYRVLGNMAASRGDHRAAVKYFQRARALDPLDTSVLLQLARSAEKAGEADLARGALRRAVEIQPGNAAIAAELAGFLLRRGDLTGATLVLSDGLDQNPADTRLLQLATETRRRVMTQLPDRSR